MAYPKQIASKASIDNFLGCLSSSDLIYVRDQTRKIILDRFASFVDLPSELIGIILPYLHLEDILNCRLVSRGWWAIFTDDDIASRLCSRFFPGLQRAHHGPAECLFLDANRRFIRRRIHRSKYRVFIDWDSSWSTDMFRNPVLSSSHSIPPVDTASLAVLYNDGKLAWQPCSTVVIVDDLVTLQRLHCPLGNLIVREQQMRLVAVTKNLLILGVSRGSTDTYPVFNAVRVWHMSEKRWEALCLPGDCNHCYAADDRVAFLTWQRQVIVWSWGSKAAALELENFEDNSGFLRLSNCRLVAGTGWQPIVPVSSLMQNMPGIIWHPQHRDIMYVVRNFHHRMTENFDAPPSPKTLNTASVLVIKYRHGREVRKIFKRVDGHGTDCRWVWPVPCGRATDSYGGRFVGALVGTRETAFAVTILFNVLTETFFRRRYVGPCVHYFHPAEFPKTPSGRQYLFSGLAWDDHLVTGTGTVHSHGEGPMATWYEADSKSANCASKVDIDECQDIVESSFPGPFPEYGVMGDGKFLLFVSPFGVNIWGFRRRPPL
ncbi:hypothetical protein XA68_15354 [Ophiocordyceps unilateralis]|uniref:F-box domain-containing protein n=1 Tax=Ophiocordyceps unilateralis TaxID=268505 RepID=A0A2A9P8N4_OPHUN|nr:hypothetical protein XA68_15354 [Ophiocordyceps unilateralis]